MGQLHFRKGIIILIFIVAITLRGYAALVNIYQHGDVALYSAAAESLATRGNFLVDPDISQPYFYSLAEKGGRYLEHNPLWPLLGSLLVRIFGMSGFMALKVLSVISGSLLLPLVYFLGRKLGGNAVGMFAAGLTASSYLLIDFSGNGSFYIFQTVLYILFLLFIPEQSRSWSPLLIGGIIALTTLLNQQALVLFLVYAVSLWLSFSGDYRKFILSLAGAAAVMVLFFLPWGVRGYLTFGSPFYSIALTNIWQKMGVPEIVQHNVISYAVTPATYRDLFWSMLTFWVPHNLYYANRQLFVLAPLSYIAALFLAVEMLFASGYQKSKQFLLLPLVLVVLAHVGISVAWPIFKFRYFVPLLPLVFIMAGYYIFYFLERRHWRQLIAGACVLATVALSALTYFSTPAHTYYNGGTITTDIFGKNGELDFVRSQEQR